MSNRLGIGDVFPSTEITLSDDSKLNLALDLGDGFKVVLFYRGSW